MAHQKTKKRGSKRTVRPKKRLFLPYPLLVFLLLCTGVLLAGWTLKASGNDLIVNAKVPGPPVTDRAAITNLQAGSHFKAIPIAISGTCPANAAYVEIFDNNLMSGSAICQNGAFDPQITLSPGENQLTVQGFNITDDPGPVSQQLIVFYDAPVSSPTASGAAPSSGAASPKTPPLVLKTAFVYKGYYIGQEVKWPLAISGGKAPYALDVDWGDGQSSIISRPNGSQFNITHTYQKAGGYKDSYTIKVQASDAAGDYAYLQFFVIINPGGTGALINNKPPPSCIVSKDMDTADVFCGTEKLAHKTASWLWMAWPLYGAALLMAISFKLGEREELIILRKRRKIRSS